MSEIIGNLEKINRDRHYLLKTITRRTLQPDFEIVQKILTSNQELFTIVEQEEFRHIISDGIRKPRSREFLTNIVEGSKTRESGIIPLVKLQIRLLNNLMALQSNNLEDVNFHQTFAQLVDLLTRELLLVDRLLKDLTALYQKKLSLRVIGYGEISTVLEFTGGATFQNQHPERENWVYKKMPVFPGMSHVEKFIDVFHEYRRLFVEDIGIQVPEQRTRIHPIASDKIRLYVLQKKFHIDAVGNKLIHYFNETECSNFLGMILHELSKVWIFNKNHVHIKVAIDGQISNWIIDNFNPHNDKLTGQENLIYIDTSSPLFRIDGEEQLDAELFLKSTPFFLRPIIRALFLQEVLDRYYDLHLVTVDLIANFFKEGKAEFIPKMIETANSFFATQMADFNIQPIIEQEVTKYYKNDAFIWRFYLAARKIDRFITEKIMRKKYEFRLPDKVKR